MSRLDDAVSQNAENADLIRDDGSKVATEDSPSGETETEKMQREESKLPNGGRSPEYDDAERESGIASPAPRTGS